LANFGGLSAGAFDDPDGDGNTNIAEMLAGTLPQDAASRPGWKSPRGLSAGFHRRPRCLPDAFSADIYQLQTTTDLGGPWQNVGSIVTGKNGLLALPHVDGALDPKRFDRILIDN